VTGWLRRHYGAGPLHLLGLLASLALAGYGASRVAQLPQATRVAVWFVGGAIGHDLVLWPLYALADRGAVRAARRHPDRLPRTPWINHLRVPAVISGVLLAVSFPLVLRLSPGPYQAATGLTPAPYLQRWLLITGTLFALSAIIYAVRVGRATRLSRGTRLGRAGSGATPPRASGTSG
jgi:hypothetical protein